MLALICVLLIPVSSFCEEGTSSEEERVLHLPGFYQDGMVLQSDRSVQIYGFSMSNQFQVNVKLSCDGSVEEYVIPGSKFKPKMLDNKDRFIWKVFLSEKSNGQECDLEFEQAREKIALSVVFGDVWLCSGQSNMKFPMGELMNATEELEASKSYHNIRMFKVHITFSSIPKYDITLSKINTWFNPMDQEKLTHFSALCFLYAR